MRRLHQGIMAVLLSAAFVAGCSWFDTKGIDYKSASNSRLPPLEVPPDLTRPGRDDRYAIPDVSPSGTATYSQYNAERQGARSASNEVLPTSGSVRVVRDRDTRYLVVAEPPEKVWPVVREFWLENGFLIKVEIPDAGVMETDWAENRAKIPQDPLRNLLGKYLDQMYSSGERDKFRTRLERTADGKGTEIYISHRGVVEQLVNNNLTNTGYDAGTVWQPRPADPELEAEFLRLLMVKLGVDETRAKEQMGSTEKREERAKLVTASDGRPVLDVSEPFDRAWRRVGLALDRVGFTVEDRDRSKGIYFVRYVDPVVDGNPDKGLLAKLAFWRSTEPNKAAQYQVVVKATDQASNVQILNKDGTPETGAASKKILSLLYDQLK